MGVTAAVLGAISLGSSVYSSIQQDKAQKKALRDQQRAEMEARKIAAEKKPMEEAATLKTNTGVNQNVLNALGLTIAPTQKSSTGLNTTSQSGLGY